MLISKSQKGYPSKNKQKWQDRPNEIRTSNVKTHHLNKDKLVTVYLPFV